MTEDEDCTDCREANPANCMRMGHCVHRDGPTPRPPAPATPIERDAARYRFLRARPLDAVHLGGIFIGKTPDNVVLSLEDADAAVDAAMSSDALRSVMTAIEVLTSPIPSRIGWAFGGILVPTKDGHKVIEAMVHLKGTLAVHPMVGGDEGFAVSLAVGGLRLSWAGGVFATWEAALNMAERMDAARADWPLIAWGGWTDAQRRVVEPLMEAAERRGEILPGRVFPSSAR